MDTTGLSSADIEILRYVLKHDGASIEKIKSALRSVASVELRLARLAKQDLSASLRIPLDNTSYLLQDYQTERDQYGCSKSVPLGTYHMTELGKIAVQDYDLRMTQARRDLWAKSVWLPVLMTAITYALVNTALPWLLQKLAS